MGASKELFNESRGHEKPSAKEILKQLIACKDEKRQDELMQILSRVEPYNIVNREYFNLVLESPLKNLKRVYHKYRIYGYGYTIRRSWQMELSSKITYLENLQTKKSDEESKQDIFEHKLEIAKQKNIKEFIFNFKGDWFVWYYPMETFKQIIEL